MSSTLSMLLFFVLGSLALTSVLGTGTTAFDVNAAIIGHLLEDVPAGEKQIYFEAGTTYPTCRSYLGSVYKFCAADKPLRKWGIGPEGEAAAVVNCQQSFANDQEECKASHYQYIACYENDDPNRMNDHTAIWRTWEECKKDAALGNYPFFGLENPGGGESDQKAQCMLLRSLPALRERDTAEMGLTIKATGVESKCDRGRAEGTYRLGNDKSLAVYGTEAPPHPSCGMADGMTVYTGCGETYVMESDFNTSCGALTRTTKLVLSAACHGNMEVNNVCGGGSCGMPRNMEVYNGCGYTYVMEKAFEEQCNNQCVDCKSVCAGNGHRRRCRNGQKKVCKKVWCEPPTRIIFDSWEARNGYGFKYHTPTTYPTCQSYRSSVYKFCAEDKPLKKWGIGPEGEAQALANCRNSFANLGIDQEECQAQGNETNEVAVGHNVCIDIGTSDFECNKIKEVGPSSPRTRAYLEAPLEFAHKKGAPVTSQRGPTITHRGNFDYTGLVTGARHGVTCSCSQILLSILLAIYVH